MVNGKSNSWYLLGLIVDILVGIFIWVMVYLEIKVGIYSRNNGRSYSCQTSKFNDRSNNPKTF